MKAPWLQIIGVTEAGMSALSPTAINTISSAQHVFGSARLLEFVRETSAGNLREWQSPFASNIERLKSLRGRSCVILASGDPLWFGVGATVMKHFAVEEIEFTPAVSSFQFAAAEMNWSLQACQTISLHGRKAQNLARALAPNQHILALTADHSTVDEVAILLDEHGYLNAELTVLENLGGAEFQRTNLALKQALKSQHDIGDFYVLAIDTGGSSQAALSCVPGLPDVAFEHDGQLTKRDARAMTLAKLAPLRNQTLWDVGAGCGSVSIEWMRAAPNSHAVAIERDHSRCEMMARNAQTLGVPALQIVQEDAQTAVQKLAFEGSPDAVFIGGNADDDSLFLTCWSALPIGGRMVVNAVTTAAQASLFKRQAALGGELTQVSISTLGHLGGQTIMRPKLPILQWCITKGTGE